MEDFRVDIVIGQGPAARAIKLHLEPFTLIGATTKAGLLGAPLRDRFGIVQAMSFYSPKELAAILLRSAAILGVELAQDAAKLIALRSRGTPRIANRLLRRVRDYAEVKASGKVDKKTAGLALAMLDIDQLGLTSLDRRYLDVLLNTFKGGPVGIESLAASLQEEVGTLEDLVEPFLLEKALVQRTPRGALGVGGCHRPRRHKAPRSPGALLRGAQLSSFSPRPGLQSAATFAQKPFCTPKLWP